MEGIGSNKDRQIDVWEGLEVKKTHKQTNRGVGGLGSNKDKQIEVWEGLEVIKTDKQTDRGVGGIGSKKDTQTDKQRCGRAWK